MQFDLVMSYVQAEQGLMYCSTDRDNEPKISRISL
jgi:hypothetical protein